MADFEVDKTSGRGPTLVRVRPSGINDTSSDKTNLLIVDVNGVTKAVNLLQKKGNPSYEYRLEVDKDTLSILGKGGTDNLSIISQRRETLNGTPLGDWEDVEVTAEFLEEPPFTAAIRFNEDIEKTLEVSITSKNYTEQPLEGTLVIKQSETGDTKSISIIQEAGRVSYSYHLEPSAIWIEIPRNQVSNAYEGEVGFGVTGYKDKYIEGEKIGDSTVMAFKIPYIAENQEVWVADGVKVTYWITNYGNIAHEFSSSFSAVAHAKKDAGLFLNAMSGSYECIFVDGGKCNLSPMLVPILT